MSSRTMKNNKKNKKKLIGGHKVYIDLDREEGWETKFLPLGSFSTDCVPNCFNILRYANKETCILMAALSQKEYNANGDVVFTSGLNEKEMMDILDLAYPGSQLAWLSILKHTTSDDTFPPEVIDEMHQAIDYALQLTEATLACIDIYNEEELFESHAFVISKTILGEHLAIDAQTNEMMSLEHYLFKDFVNIVRNLHDESVVPDELTYQCKILCSKNTTAKSRHVAIYQISIRS